MIYSTNRSMSIGDIDVDVNESYFGAGALNFMQENAQDELALFESAIKTDIDEVFIGESAYELEALHENFVERTINKIKEIVKKFIEWLRGVTRSAIAKLSQLLVRDNKNFCKIARRQIAKMRNGSKFEYSGKTLNFAKLPEFVDAEKVTAEKKLENNDSIYTRLSNAKKMEELTPIEEDLNREKENSSKTTSLEDSFDKECVNEDGEIKGIDPVKQYIEYLEGMDSKYLKKLKAKLKSAERKAKEKEKRAERAVKNDKSKDDEASKFKTKQLSLMAEALTFEREETQALVKSVLYAIKQSCKIARAVVAKAMGASPKNEGFEYTPELVQAMIESADWDYDEALEEMSEASDVDDIDDEFDDDDED